MHRSKKDKDKDAQSRTRPPAGGLFDARFLVVVLAAAFGLRLAWVLLVHSLPVSDFERHNAFALNILKGQGYGDRGAPSATWARGYSFFLAGLYALFGKSLMVAKVANVVLQVLTVALTYAFCRIALGLAAARWAAALLAVWPGQFPYAGLLASESLFMFVFLVAALLLSWLTEGLRERKRWLGKTVIAGLVIGLCALVRGMALILVIAAPITWLLMRVPLRTVAKAALALGMATLVAISPWTVRNWLVMRSFILIAGDFSDAVWMGANPHTTGKYMPPDPELFGGMTNQERWRAQMREGIRFIVQHPVTYLGYAPRKLLHLIGDDSIGFFFAVAQVSRPVPAFLDLRTASLNIADVNYTFYMAVLLLAAVGSIPALRAGRGGVFIVVLLLAWLAAHALLLGGDRYHVPMAPWIAMLAGSTLAWAGGLVGRMMRRSRR